MPRTKRLHALKRPKVRQDWSKWNLYNLSRLRTPTVQDKTVFQQKWAAKSLLRSYHNPDVREGSWTRMFDRRLPGVVPMDHRYLAAHDGSERAAGRGLGIEKRPERNLERGSRPVQKTPYMNMAFHPLERRLDTAIFRALFASSTRQARQFVIHGSVKVNGKKMIYPGYQLNPGDMFQVDPERVMFATGAKKSNKHKPGSDQARIRAAEEAEVRRIRKDREEEDRAVQGFPQESDESEAGAATLEVAEAENALEGRAKYSKELKKIIQRAQAILDDSKRDLSGKRQQELRAFRKEVKSIFSRLRGMEESEIGESVDGFETMLAEILTKVPSDSVPESEKLATATAQASEEAGKSSDPQLRHVEKTDAYRARKDAELLAAALERARANPIDTTKPYATPWQPRDYMSAFAFIPRYLEVNQNICSAVYIRHPTARPGLAEIPTPFSAETLTLGFNWYLRRR